MVAEMQGQDVVSPSWLNTPRKFGVIPTPFQHRSKNLIGLRTRVLSVSATTPEHTFESEHGLFGEFAAGRHDKYGIIHVFDLLESDLCQSLAFRGVCGREYAVRKLRLERSMSIQAQMQADLKLTEKHLDSFIYQNRRLCVLNLWHSI